MIYQIAHTTKNIKGTILLTASKSESNRALIIQALCSEHFEIENLAKAQDTVTLKTLLDRSEKTDEIYDTGPAGTTMRFLTAYLATLPGKRILTGSERMKQRPIGLLVNALNELGADIQYLEKEGYPPLQINGNKIKGGEIEIDGSISSQFISALLLISPVMQNGLVIKFKGNIISRPYINMTLKMMEEFRVYGQWHGNSISVSPQQYHKKSDPDYKYLVDGDWSAASYWYSMAALANEADLKVMGLKHPSLQGDSIVSELYSFFGIKTNYIENGIHLTKIKVKDEHFGYNFSDCPDIAQTAAVTAAALKIPSFFNGLSTLKIKETDRLLALQQELKKFNCKMDIINDEAIELSPENFVGSEQAIATYEDHRMAMAFTPLALKSENINIMHPEVVSKSYPHFWDDLKEVGFEITEIHA